MTEKKIKFIKSTFKKYPANKSTKLLCLLVSSIAYKNNGLIEHSFELLMEYKVSTAKIYESILQTYLFCGFPAAIEALMVFDNFYPDHSKPAYKYNSVKYLKDGSKNCKIIYGDSFKKLIRNFKKISPEMEQWMLIEGYGKVFNRKSLNLKQRELLNVCMLSVNFYPRQLYSHINGCKNTGITKNQLLEVLDLILPIMAKKRISKIKDIVNSIFI
ncbi:hypothetical protein BH10BAC5_BH10BAC5_00650 [soil metagenome]